MNKYLLILTLLCGQLHANEGYRLLMGKILTSGQVAFYTKEKLTQIEQISYTAYKKIHNPPLNLEYGHEHLHLHDVSYTINSDSKKLYDVTKHTYQQNKNYIHFLASEKIPNLARFRSKLKKLSYPKYFLAPATEDLKEDVPHLQVILDQSNQFSLNSELTKKISIITKIIKRIENNDISQLNKMMRDLTL